jgi:hypothetical protein
LTSFAGGWVVVPNKLDFNYIFANMDFLKNPTVYATLIAICVIYLVGVIICRRADLKDVERVSLELLRLYQMNTIPARILVHTKHLQANHMDP